MWNKPCAECYHCIPIGDGDGLCDYPRKIEDKKIVGLFDIEPNCPYGEKDHDEEWRNARDAYSGEREEK